MTIRRAVLCDQCDAVYASNEQLPNRQLLDEAHHDGWSSTVTRGIWTNQCPDHETN